MDKSAKNQLHNILRHDFGKRCYLLYWIIHLVVQLYFIVSINRTGFFHKHFCKTASLNKAITPDIQSTSQKLTSIANARDVNFNATIITDTGSSINDDTLRRGDHGRDELLSEDLNRDLPGSKTDCRSESVDKAANITGTRAQTDCRSETVDRTANSVGIQALTGCRSEIVDRTVKSAGPSGNSSVVSILFMNFDEVDSKFRFQMQVSNLLSFYIILLKCK